MCSKGFGCYVDVCIYSCLKALNLPSPRTRTPKNCSDNVQAGRVKVRNVHALTGNTRPVEEIQMNLESFLQSELILYDPNSLKN